MSRKDYRATADLIKSQRRLDGPTEATRLANDTLRNIADGMPSIFKADNSRFDRQKFMEACGL